VSGDTQDAGFGTMPVSHFSPADRIPADRVPDVRSPRDQRVATRSTRRVAANHRRAPAPQHGCRRRESADCLTARLGSLGGRVAGKPLSYPVLAYFRSQHEDQSWIAALALILDVSAF